MLWLAGPALIWPQHTSSTIKPARALNNLEIAVVLDKGNFAAHGLMVEALARLGDREEALLRSFYSY